MRITSKEIKYIEERFKKEEEHSPTSLFALNFREDIIFSKNTNRVEEKISIEEFCGRMGKLNKNVK